MDATWSVERIEQLAPDASALAAGRALSIPRKWQSLGRSEGAVWGEIRGSAADPYRTRVDLRDAACRCSCPSRKLPCKHSLGLLLAFARDPGGIPAREAPGWVAEWLASRDERVEKRARKETEAEAPADEEARARRESDQARRAARREASVAAGIEDLATLLRDTVRRGLAAAKQEPMSFWDRAAARLVDAQAPGCGRLVRELGEAAASGLGWEERLLERLARLHLLVEAYRRIGSLDPGTRDEVRSLLGWTQSREEVLSRAGVEDRWLVLGREVEAGDPLTVQRTWLWGSRSLRGALILDFAQGNAPLDPSLPPGAAFEGRLSFYDGAHPLRALADDRKGPFASVEGGLPGIPRIADVLEAAAAALAANPWLDRIPYALRGVTPCRDAGAWLLRDRDGSALPIDPSSSRTWELVAASGGADVDVFGTWDGTAFLPMSAVADGRWISLEARARR